MAQNAIRSFLAIELSDDVKTEAADFIREIQVNFQTFRFIPPHNWHLTLHFLGGISLEKIDLLKTCLPVVASKIQPFKIALEEFGAFPSSRNARLLWLGVRSDSDQLTELKNHLDDFLQTMHFKIEKREFHPHITIARLKKTGETKFLPKAAGRHFKGTMASRVNHVTLFKSTLSSVGSEYTPIKIFTLGGNQLKTAKVT